MPTGSVSPFLQMKAPPNCFGGARGSAISSASLLELAGRLGGRADHQRRALLVEGQFVDGPISALNVSRLGDPDEFALGGSEGDFSQGARAAAFGNRRITPRFSVVGQFNLVTARIITRGTSRIEAQAGDGGRLGQFHLEPHPRRLVGSLT